MWERRLLYGQGNVCWNFHGIVFWARMGGWSEGWEGIGRGEGLWGTVFQKALIVLRIFGDRMLRILISRINLYPLGFSTRKFFSLRILEIWNVLVLLWWFFQNNWLTVENRLNIGSLVIFASQRKVANDMWDFVQSFWLTSYVIYREYLNLKMSYLQKLSLK